MPQHGLVFQITQNIMTILDRRDAPQRAVEKRLQVVFLAAGSRGRDDLVQIQIGEEVGRFPAVTDFADFGFVE